MFPLPVPLHGFQGLLSHAGTGFLVTNGPNVWLVTCAHIITGLKETPPSKSLFFGARLQVVDTSADLYPFDGADQRVSVVINQSNGFLVDTMAIKLTTDEATALLPYGAYDLSTIIAPTPGEAVTATGFPSIGPTLIEPQTMTGRVADVVGLSVKLTVPSITGFSGSALLGETGLMGIVHGDVGEAPFFTNGLAISFCVIGPKLFV